MNNFDHILWVFSSKAFLPSDIIGGIYPANFLKIKQLIFLSNHDPSKTLDILKPKLIILGKCLNSNIINLTLEAKKRKIYIISIFDDWHFEPQSSREKIKFNFNKELAFLADTLIVKSEGAKKLIKKNLNIESRIINDCVRYKSLEPRSKISDEPKLLWFGTSSNHDTLITAINEIIETNVYFSLSIVTNVTENIKNFIDNINKDKIKIKIIEFSESNLIKEAELSEVIIIPLFNDFKRLVKSSNRFVDAINFGRFIITNKTKLHDELKPYCYSGNIIDGINWGKKNQKKLFNMIVKGQNFVKNSYSIKSIALEWKKLINDKTIKL